MNKHKNAEFVIAFLEGKEVELRNPKYEDSKWESVDYLSQLDEKTIWEYRIKPTPEIIPFTFEDWNELLDHVIVNQSGSAVGLITNVTNKGVYTGATYISFGFLLNYWKFKSGEVCGKVVK